MQWLTRHPDGPEEGASSIEASLVLGPRGWTAQFLIRGDASLVLPPRRPGRRKDGLWRHTCLELFLKPKGSQHYFEFNFSPSSQWAAYEFDGYRAGMRPFHMRAPRISPHRMGDDFNLLVSLDWRGRAAVKSWQVGLCAVIETASGALSHWALAHPRGEADFHHPDCFALELTAPDGA